MENKGLDSLLKTSRVTEWTLNNGGYLPVSFGGFLIGGCIVAYIVAVARGNVDAFLPLISDAAGSPPQNGLFGTLICIGGMIGIVFMLLRYMIVMEQNQEKSKMVTFLNKVSLVFGILSMFGITLVTGYPVNFYRNKDVWLQDVGIPHMIGGVMLFALGLVYIGIQCILTMFLKTKDKNSILLTRVAICFTCTAAFVYHLVTVPDNFGGLAEFYFSNDSSTVKSVVSFPKTLGSSLKLPIDTSGSYLSSAITEWILVFMFCGFFFTFFKETQEYSLQVVIETHSTEPERLSEVASETSGQRKASEQISPARRQSEVKTFFRRDSTCQTIPDDEDSTQATEGDRYTQKRLSSFEALSGDKLQKLIENKMKIAKEVHKKGSADDKTTTQLNGTHQVNASIREEEETAELEHVKYHKKEVETADKAV